MKRTPPSSGFAGALIIFGGLIVLGMNMGLSIKRNEGESWLDCALRYGRKYGLEHEIKTEYDESIAAGNNEEDAAWGAVYEWDCCDLTVEGDRKTKRHTVSGSDAADDDDL